jgi:hypothetical protein
MTISFRSISKCLAAMLFAGAVGCASGPEAPPLFPAEPLLIPPAQASTGSAQPVAMQKPPLVRSQTPERSFIETTPGAPMRDSGEVRQVQFESGPPLAPPPNDFGGAPAGPNFAAPNNAAPFVPADGGRALPPPPGFAPLVDPAWPGVVTPEVEPSSQCRRR